jgi:hypothetical protein
MGQSVFVRKSSEMEDQRQSQPFATSTVVLGEPLLQLFVVLLGRPCVCIRPVPIGCLPMAAWCPIAMRMPSRPWIQWSEYPEYLDADSRQQARRDQNLEVEVAAGHLVQGHLMRL